jgi:hypothetical protein
MVMMDKEEHAIDLHNIDTDSLHFKELGWTVVEIPYDLGDSFHFHFEIEPWLKENNIEKFVHYYFHPDNEDKKYYIALEHESDAILFTLRWS